MNLPPANELDEIFRRLDFDEVKAYLRDRCLWDDGFRRSFLLRFQRLVRPMSKQEFEAQVQAILQSGMDRSGYISYDTSGEVATKVSEVLETASGYLAAKDFAPAFHAATAVLEKMNDALQYADDSLGEIGGCVKQAVILLREMTGIQALDAETRSEAFAYCCTAFQNARFSDWDWHQDMLRLAGEFAITEGEAQKVIVLAQIPTEFEWNKESQKQVASAMREQFPGMELE
jgi:hypothetical protein